MSDMKRAILMSMLAGLALASNGCISGCDHDYSDGERVGVITKFSHKGLLIKSWEGQMNLGGMVSKTDDKGNSYMTANVWEFTARDPDVIEQVTRAMNGGGRAKLTYRQWLISPLSMDSDYEVVRAEPTP